MLDGLFRTLLRISQTARSLYCVLKAGRGGSWDAGDGAAWGCALCPAALGAHLCPETPSSGLEWECCRLGDAMCKAYAHVTQAVLPRQGLAHAEHVRVFSAAGGPAGARRVFVLWSVALVAAARIRARMYAAQGRRQQRAEMCQHWRRSRSAGSQPTKTTLC